MIFIDMRKPRYGAIVTSSSRSYSRFVAGKQQHRAFHILKLLTPRKLKKKQNKKR